MRGGNREESHLPKEVVSCCPKLSVLLEVEGVVSATEDRLYLSVLGDENRLALTLSAPYPKLSIIIPSVCPHLTVVL